MPISVTLHRLAYAGPRQTALIQAAIDNLRRAVNHQRFATLVKAARFRESRWRASNGRWRSLTPTEVLARVEAGRERDTAIDQDIDLEIELKPKSYPTVGSTSLGHLPIRTAYWFINGCLERNDRISPARHFIHEWLHVSGFYHYPNNDAREDVPYVLGSIVRKILREDFREEEDPEMAKAVDEEHCGCIDPFDNRGLDEGPDSSAVDVEPSEDDLVR